MSTPRRTPPRDRSGTSDDTLVFVDAIEDDQARLLAGVEAFNVPARLLPADIKEGSWLRLSFVAAPAPPDDGAALRQKLGGSDDGGDIKL
jgi:hypothetical protein